MKKKFRVALLFCLAAAILLTGMTGCGKKGVPDRPSIVGFSENREVTPEDMEIFNQALEGLTGVAYEPALVATQPVTGMNYRFKTAATPVIPEPYSYTAYVYIFKPADGPAVLLNIEKAAEPAS